MALYARARPQIGLIPTVHPAILIDMLIDLSNVLEVVMQ